MHTFDNINIHESGLYQGIPNVFGGNDIYHNGELVQSSMPNAFGGEDLYDGGTHLKGQTIPNVFGGEDYYSFEGNVDDILMHQDPLLHANECKFPHLKLS